MGQLVAVALESAVHGHLDVLVALSVVSERPTNQAERKGLHHGPSRRARQRDIDGVVVVLGSGGHMMHL
eukprot:CAMPEP_0204402430 /NCGR_PEP_ID=MMETSP0470-20130426/5308_1 /ASSEMBLY_ACC=CAM_ASM_000385 /TAXON_ID=2969 /ORGANISM="Oxyrrhis marina" /LENGTH=68 /DNA_ID=CAMNT_0051397513 /DNA_START=167 /DNA_END=370 /DNA_ORIENTATION=+